MIRIEAVPVLAKEILAGLKMARQSRTPRYPRRQERARLAAEKATKAVRKPAITAAPAIA